MKQKTKEILYAQCVDYIEHNVDLKNLPQRRSAEWNRIYSKYRTNALNPGLPRIWFERVLKSFAEKLKTANIDLAEKAGQDLFQRYWGGRLPE